MAFQNILSPFGPATSNQYAQAAAGPLSAAFGSIGNFAGAIGNMGSSYMQGLGNQGTAYSNNYGSYAGGLNGANNALAGTMGAYTQGLGSLGQSGAQTFGYLGQGLQGLGNASASAYGAMGQGLGNLGSSYAGAFNGYANALGGVGQAMASDRAGFYNANSTAEAARQVALGNIGTAALGSYGQAANSALGAWAQNQQAYNQALAGLGGSNQNALAQAAASRNQALGAMGQSYSDLGGRLGASSVLGNMNLGFNSVGAGSDRFNAAGPNGQIASGTYGGGDGGGFAARVSDTSQLADMGAPAYGGLSRLQDNLMSSDITGSMNANYADSMNRLAAQHYSSRQMPSQMLGQTLSGLLTMGRDAYGQIRGGMNQYYDTQNNPANRADYASLLSGLSQGLQGASDNIGSAQRDLVRGYGDFSSGLSSLQGSLLGGFGTTMSAFPGYARDMRSTFDTTRGDINANTGRLTDGFGNANANVGSVVGSLGSGFQSGVGALKDLFGESVGKLDLFKSPLELAQQQRAVDLYNRRNAASDMIGSMRSAPGGFDWQPYIDNWQKRLDNIPYA